MNTEKTHVRFWEAMRARFGKRWMDEFGDAPTAPWIQLLNQHTPNHLRDALELMSAEKLAHPPTLPQFEAFLKRAATKRPNDGVDHVRNYWRNFVIATCMRHAGLLNIVPYGEQRLTNLPLEVYEVADRICRELMEWGCDAERKTGQRTPSMEQHVNSELWNVLKPWARERGQWHTAHTSDTQLSRETEQLALEG